MKFRKIYALLLTSFLFVACSEEESWNSSDVTVNMAQEEVLVKESAGIFNVPVTVSGELNGPIKVTVEVTEAGENPAMEDVHYIVTSKSIVIILAFVIFTFPECNCSLQNRLLCFFELNLFYFLKFFHKLF